MDAHPLAAVTPALESRAPWRVVDLAPDRMHDDIAARDECVLG